MHRTMGGKNVCVKRSHSDAWSFREKYMFRSMGRGQKSVPCAFVWDAALVFLFVMVNDKK